ncbi:MAG: hypothetical protein J0H63_03980 [Rhizobiales bacterium]|nr:hypothetical protein [Hyphomicrobiales bacterium]MBN9009313.1 hypothetical protein [Hyphomicrobiales bacterium]
MTAAFAAAPPGGATSINTFKSWTAYKSGDGAAKMCFVASQPTDTKYQPAGVKSRDPAFFMLTTIPAKKIKNEASTIIGYAFKGGSKVTVDIGGKKFTMFTDKDNAWIENPEQEGVLVTAMKGGSTMSVQGTSSRGTISTDTYSLAGITQALDAIAKECP